MTFSMLVQVVPACSRSTDQSSNTFDRSCSSVTAEDRSGPLSLYIQCVRAPTNGHVTGTRHAQKASGEISSSELKYKTFFTKMFLELNFSDMYAQCVIDLKENCLKIGTTNTKAVFLSEKDIPKAKEDSAYVNSEGPSGSGPSAAGRDTVGRGERRTW